MPLKAFIAQLATGEGKSIVIAMLAVFMVTIFGKRVHVLENNEGLLERDCTSRHCSNRLTAHLALSSDAYALPCLSDACIGRDTRLADATNAPFYEKFGIKLMIFRNILSLVQGQDLRDGELFDSADRAMAISQYAHQFVEGSHAAEFVEGSHAAVS